MDETNELVRRNGMAIAVGTRILAQSLYQLANLIEMANQPFPEPQKAPLVGDDRLAKYEGICARCESLEHTLCADAPGGKRICCNCFADIYASFVEASKMPEPPEDETPLSPPPASGKRTIDAPWIPDERPTYGTDRREPTVPTIATSADLPPGTEVVWKDESGRLIRDTTGLHVVDGMVVRDLPQSEAQPVADHPASTPAIESVEEPKSGKRAKNEFTAREWRNSIHFLNLMKQKEFSSWNALNQIENGDKFVEYAEHTWPNLKMNRWGDRFKKFHGIK